MLSTLPQRMPQRAPREVLEPPCLRRAQALETVRLVLGCEIDDICRTIECRSFNGRRYYVDGGQERVVVVIGKELVVVAVVCMRGYRLGFHSPRLPSEAIEKGGESYTSLSIKRCTSVKFSGQTTELKVL
jgi:hypothetical protein